MPLVPAVPKPEVLKFEAKAIPGQDPAEAESEEGLMEAVKKHGMPPIVTKLLPDAKPLPPYKAGQFVDQTSFDESHAPKGTSTRTDE